MATESDRVSFERFYEAVGRATTSWFALEEALRDIFTRLIVCSLTGTMRNITFDQVWVLGNVFYSSTNLRARLAMITETMDRLVTDKAIVTEWNAAKNRVLTLYKRRNTLAHGAVWGNETAGASFIGPAMFSSDRRRLTYVQVCACDKSFQKQAERLTNIAIAVNKHLAR